MKRIKNDLPIYVLSAALVFLGISISTQQAGAAATNDPRVSALQNELSTFKQCANNNFRELNFFSTSGNSRSMFIRTCR
jgi:hypothetical protein